LIQLGVVVVDVQTETQRSVASVLVIVQNSSIEALLGELIAFAGYRPLFDVTAGAAGESVRRFRPDVTLLDTGLRPSVVTACLGACTEVGSALVLMSSNNASADELAAQASALGCLSFALPAGPKPLARTIELALAGRSSGPVITVPMRRQHPVHPALRAALSAVARARALALHIAATGRVALPGDGASEALGETGVRALRAAVTDYTRQLKSERVPVDGILRRVQDAIADCAIVVGAEAAIPKLLLESDSWARAAYHAA